MEDGAGTAEKGQEKNCGDHLVSGGGLIGILMSDHSDPKPGPRTFVSTYMDVDMTIEMTQ